MFRRGIIVLGKGFWFSGPASVLYGSVKSELEDKKKNCVAGGGEKQAEKRESPVMSVFSSFSLGCSLFSGFHSCPHRLAFKAGRQTVQL